MRRNSFRDGDWPAAPERLPGPVLDSHTHLDLQEVDVDEAIEGAAEVNVARVVQVGVDVPTSRWGAELADRHSSVLAAVALHPNEAPLLAAKGELDVALAEIDALAALPSVHGVGETGLDYFRTEPTGRDAQRDSFDAHIEIAKRHDKTLIIHDRDAHDDVLARLAAVGAPDRVIFHCFSGDADFARRCAEAGYFLSFAGNITFKNAQMLRDAAAIVPLNNLLVETDGPFLTPIPHRGKPNGPYLIPITVRFIAELRGMELAEFCAAIWSNGERAFAVR